MLRPVAQEVDTQMSIAASRLLYRLFFVFIAVQIKNIGSKRTSVSLGRFFFGGRVARKPWLRRPTRSYKQKEIADLRKPRQRWRRSGALGEQSSSGCWRDRKEEGNNCRLRKEEWEEIARSYRKLWPFPHDVPADLLDCPQTWRNGNSDILSLLTWWRRRGCFFLKRPNVLVLNASMMFTQLFVSVLQVDCARSGAGDPEKNETRFPHWTRQGFCDARISEAVDALQVELQPKRYQEMFRVNVRKTISGLFQTYSLKECRMSTAGWQTQDYNLGRDFNSLKREIGNPESSVYFSWVLYPIGYLSRPVVWPAWLEPYARMILKLCLLQQLAKSHKLSFRKTMSGLFQMYSLKECGRAEPSNYSTKSVRLFQPRLRTDSNSWIQMRMESAPAELVHLTPFI